MTPCQTPPTSRASKTCPDSNRTMVSSAGTAQWKSLIRKLEPGCGLLRPVRVICIVCCSASDHRVRHSCDFRIKGFQSRNLTARTLRFATQYGSHNTVKYLSVTSLLPQHLCRTHWSDVCPLCSFRNHPFILQITSCALWGPAPLLGEPWEFPHDNRNLNHPLYVLYIRSISGGH